MRTTAVRTLLVWCCAICSTAAFSLPMTVDPDVGLDSVGIDQRFYWDSGVDGEFLFNITEPAPLNSIGSPGGGPATYDPYWEITTASDATINLEAIDGYMLGDAFELVFDSAAVAWDSSFNDAQGYFHGVMDDLYLSAGTHRFTLNVVSGASMGAAWFNFSAVTPAVDEQFEAVRRPDKAFEVPVPATAALVLVGLLGLARSRRAF